MEDIKTNGIPKDSAPLLFRSVPAVSDCRRRSLDEAGLQALRAHAHLEGGAIARIDPDTLKIDQPTTARMPVGMADRVPRHGAASAALTDLCHYSFPPFFFDPDGDRLLAHSSPRDCIFLPQDFIIFFQKGKCPGAGL